MDLNIERQQKGEGGKLRRKREMEDGVKSKRRKGKRPEKKENESRKGQKR